MSFTPTPEQEAIVAAAVNTNDNLIISALAGAAKTSTLVLIAQALPTTSILCLAFNKKIANEMQERLPANCTAQTLNSLGHRTWGQTLGKRLILNDKKVYDLLYKEIESLRGDDKTAMFEVMADTMKTIGLAKASGYVPDDHFPNARGLMGDDEFFASFDEEPFELQFEIARNVYLESMKQAMLGTIDFNDQILMPAIFPVSFPIYPLTLVDEAQDLSELNHVLLRKLVRTKRLMAVGDECQAIYAFRGAHDNSMQLLQESFKMRKLILSTSFRCPIEVVRHAQWRAPHMQWPDWAKPGEVRILDKWGPETLPDNAAVICRNNAPLFRTALRLLKASRYPQLIGNDIGKSLVKIMRKFGPLQMTQEQVISAIGMWKEAKLAKSRSPGSIHDQAECMTIFAEQGRDLGDAIAYAEHLFNSQGPIQLMTGHKSKGLEFDDVFILDKHLLRLDEPGQDKNVLYVMQTRAKHSLTYITTEGYIHE